jgi:Holliday junction resolvase RusA-like endonuclease
MVLRLTTAQAKMLGVVSPKKGRGGASTANKQPKSRFRVNDPQYLDQIPIEFDVPLVSQVKQRPRVFPTRDAVAKAFRIAQGNVEKFLSVLKMNAITPEATRKFEKDFRTIAMAMMAGRKPLQGPVEVHVTVLLPGNPHVWPTAMSDGDLDNHLKAAWDGLNAIVFTDDCTIVQQSSGKSFTDGDPKIRVTARPALMPGRPFVPE